VTLYIIGSLLDGSTVQSEVRDVLCIASHSHARNGFLIAESSSLSSHSTEGNYSSSYIMSTTTPSSSHDNLPYTKNHEDAHHVDAEERLEAFPDPISSSARPERMPEKSESPPSGGAEALEKKQTDESDIPEPEYPSMAKVIPIAAALYSAFFLVSLVPQPATPRSCTHD